MYGAIAQIINILRKLQENLAKCEAFKNLNYSYIEHKSVLLLSAEK